MRTDAPPLPPLLLWQTLTLAWICGLLAGRWPAAAALSLLLLIWADSRLWKPRAAVMALSVFVAGWAVCAHALPHRPAQAPAWANSNGAPLRLCGRVESVQGLPDARLRILLRAVRPASGPAHKPPDIPANTAASAPGNAPAAALVSAPAATPASVPTLEALPGTVGWTWDSPLFRPIEGQRLCVSLPLRSTVGLRNPGLADSGRWWEIQGVFWRLWSKGDRGSPRIVPSTARDDAVPGATTRQHANAALVRALGQGKTLSQGEAFIPALIFGDRTHLSSRTSDLMARASLIHSLALSGQHLALAALLAALFVHLLGRVRPGIYLHVPRPKLIVLVSLPPALAYLWLGGAPASLLRAFCMLALLAVLIWRNRIATLADTLLAALLGITLCWPLGIFDVGLQLSVLCMATLALMTPLLRRMPRPVPGTPHYRSRALLRGTAQLLLASLGIQLALLPVSLLIFGYASPWFALNVLWLPVLGSWVMPLAALGTLLAALGADTAAHAVLHLAVPPCDALLALLNALHTHGYMDFPMLLRPHWTALPAWAALMTAAALLPGRSGLSPAGKRLAVAACVLLLVGVALRAAQAHTPDLQLRVLDVGQGQALSLHLPHGRQILIDGGGSNSPRFDPGRAIVAPALAHNAAPRLWAVISTHPDSDHLRGLGHVLRSFDVARIFHNNDGLRPSAPADLRQLWTDIRRAGTPLHAGMRLELPPLHGRPLWLDVLHPPENSRFTGNNRSLVLRLVAGGKEERGLALLTGDAELPALQQLLDSGRDLRAEALVLPHHGSRHSLSPAFYDAVAPRVALVSCGRDNRYNYPAAAVTEALRQRGVTVLTTAAHGAATLRWDGEALRITTEE